jgi:hypothetical protein
VGCSCRRLAWAPEGVVLRQDPDVRGMRCRECTEACPPREIATQAFGCRPPPALTAL